MSRPTKKNPKLLEKILDAVMNGKTLKAICESASMPSLTTIYRWLRDDEEFYISYARAVAVRTHEMILEALEIADRPKSGSADVAADKLRYDARMKIAGKLNPKHYGDKPEINKEEKDTLRKVVVEIVRKSENGTEDKSE
jgi:hypothetical protein